MKLYTCTLIGFFVVLLKLSPGYADTFQFSNSKCYELQETNWQPLENCRKAKTIYSLNNSTNLFCLYRLKKEENLQSAIKAVRYYRDLKDSSLIAYANGETTSLKSKLAKVILFSKRDLLTRNSPSCQTLPQDLKTDGTYYLLHQPHSFYVLKSGLKQSSPSLSKNNIQKQSTEFRRDSKTSQQDKKGENKKIKFLIQPRLFFEEIKGTQISNSSVAEIFGKLSPGLKLTLSKNHNHWLGYGVSTSLDFHIFNERADQFLLNNNTIQTLNLSVFTKFNLYSKLSFFSKISLLEDLYYQRTSASSLGLEKELTGRFSLETPFQIYKSQVLGLMLSPRVFYDFPIAPFQKGFGFSVPLNLEVKVKGQAWSLGVEYFSVQKQLKDLELKRSEFSIFIQTKVSF